MMKTTDDFSSSNLKDLVDGTSSVKNQISFIAQQKRELRKFKLIEIMNEEEVKVHISFYHHVYPNMHHRIYFNDNTQYMLEKLPYPRIFLYEKVEILGESNVQWRLLRRFNKYPADLESDEGPLKVLSPCFSLFMDLDRADN